MNDCVYKNSINFHKLIATLLIALLHFFYRIEIDVSGWAIFVDFFFAVSGLFLAKTFEDKKLSTKVYIVKRYEKIWPHFIWGYMAYFAMLFVKCFPNIRKWGGELAHSFLEIFLLQVLGINDFASNHGAVWYLSVLMICSAILYFILGTQIKKLFIRYIGPCLAIAVIIILMMKFGTVIVEWDSRYSFIGNPSFWRGLFGMTVGIIIYYVSVSCKELFEKINKNYHINYFLQITECILLVFVIVGSVQKINTLILVLTIWAMLFMSWNLKHCALFSNKFYEKAKVLFLPVYINHALFADTQIMLRLPFPLLIQTMLYIIAVIIYSYISYRIVGFIANIIMGLRNKLLKKY